MASISSSAKTKLAMACQQSGMGQLKVAMQRIQLVKVTSILDCQHVIISSNHDKTTY